MLRHGSNSPDQRDGPGGHHRHSCILNSMHPGSRSSIPGDGSGLHASGDRRIAAQLVGLPKTHASRDSVVTSDVNRHSGSSPTHSSINALSSLLRNDPVERLCLRRSPGVTVVESLMRVGDSQRSQYPCRWPRRSSRRIVSTMTAVNCAAWVITAPGPDAPGVEGVAYGRSYRALDWPDKSTTGIR